MCRWLAERMRNRLTFGFRTFARLPVGINAVFMADDDPDNEGGGGAATGVDDELSLSPETPPAPKQPPSQPQWDLTRQYRDELAAANRREGQLKAQLDEVQQQLTGLQTQKNAGDTTLDLDQYENLKGLVVDLKGKMGESAQTINALQGQLKTYEQKESERQQRERNVEGMSLLNEECATIEKEMGLGKEHRNAILDAVGREFDENEVGSMPVKARAAWIRKSLNLAYIKAKTDKPTSKDASTKPAGERRSKPGTPVDTGTGGSPPSDEIPEGDFRSVKAAMDARDRRIATAGR